MNTSLESILPSSPLKENVEVKESVENAVQCVDQFTIEDISTLVSKDGNEFIETYSSKKETIRQYLKTESLLFDEKNTLVVLRLFEKVAQFCCLHDDIVPFLLRTKFCSNFKLDRNSKDTEDIVGACIKVYNTCVGKRSAPIDLLYQVLLGCSNDADLCKKICEVYNEVMVFTLDNLLAENDKTFLANTKSCERKLELFINIKHFSYDNCYRIVLLISRLVALDPFVCLITKFLLSSFLFVALPEFLETFIIPEDNIPFLERLLKIVETFYQSIPRSLKDVLHRMVRCLSNKEFASELNNVLSQEVTVNTSLQSILPNQIVPFTFDDAVRAKEPDCHASIEPVLEYVVKKQGDFPSKFLEAIKEYVKRTDIPIKNIHYLCAIYRKMNLVEQYFTDVKSFLNSNFVNSQLADMLTSNQVPLETKQEFLECILSLPLTTKKDKNTIMVVASKNFLNAICQAVENINNEQLMKTARKRLPEKYFTNKSSIIHEVSTVPTKAQPKSVVATQPTKEEPSKADSTNIESKEIEELMRDLMTIQKGKSFKKKIANFTLLKDFVCSSEEVITVTTAQLMVNLFQRISRYEEFKQLTLQFINSDRVAHGLSDILFKSDLSQKEKCRFAGLCGDILRSSKLQGPSKPGFVTVLESFFVNCVDDAKMEKQFYGLLKKLSIEKEESNKPTELTISNATQLNEVESKKIEEFMSDLMTIQKNKSFKKEIANFTLLKDFVCSSEEVITVTTAQLMVNLFQRISRYEEFKQLTLQFINSDRVAHGLSEILFKSDLTQEEKCRLAGLCGDILRSSKLRGPSKPGFVTVLESFFVNCVDDAKMEKQFYGLLKKLSIEKEKSNEPTELTISNATQLNEDHLRTLNVGLEARCRPDQATGQDAGPNVHEELPVSQTTTDACIKRSQYQPPTVDNQQTLDQLNELTKLLQVNSISLGWEIAVNATIYEILLQEKLVHYDVFRILVSFYKRVLSSKFHFSWFIDFLGSFVGRKQIGVVLKDPLLDIQLRKDVAVDFLNILYRFRDRISMNKKMVKDLQLFVETEMSEEAVLSLMEPIVTDQAKLKERLRTEETNKRIEQKNQLHQEDVCVHDSMKIYVEQLLQIRSIISFKIVVRMKRIKDYLGLSEIPLENVILLTKLFEQRIVHDKRFLLLIPEFLNSKGIVKASSEYLSNSDVHFLDKIQFASDCAKIMAACKSLNAADLGLLIVIKRFAQSAADPNLDRQVNNLLTRRISKDSPQAEKGDDSIVTHNKMRLILAEYESDFKAAFPFVKMCLEEYLQRRDVPLDVGIQLLNHFITHHVNGQDTFDFHLTLFLNSPLVLELFPLWLLLDDRIGKNAEHVAHDLFEVVLAIDRQEISTELIFVLEKFVLYANESSLTEKFKSICNEIETSNTAEETENTQTAEETENTQTNEEVARASEHEINALNDLLQLHDSRFLSLISKDERLEEILQRECLISADVFWILILIYMRAQDFNGWFPVVEVFVESYVGKNQIGQVLNDPHTTMFTKNRYLRAFIVIIYECRHLIVLDDEMLKTIAACIQADFHTGKMPEMMDLIWCSQMVLKNELHRKESCISESNARQKVEPRVSTAENKEKELTKEKERIEPVADKEQNLVKEKEENSVENVEKAEVEEQNLIQERVHRKRRRRKTNKKVVAFPNVEYHKAMKKYLTNILKMQNLNGFANIIRQDMKLERYMENECEIPLENVYLLVTVYERIVSTNDSQLLRLIPEFLNSKVGKHDIVRYLSVKNLPTATKQTFFQSMITILEACQCENDSSYHVQLLVQLKKMPHSIGDQQLSLMMSSLLLTNGENKATNSNAKEKSPQSKPPASLDDKMKVYLKNLLSINMKSFANNVKIATKLKPYIENTDVPLENVCQLVLVYERIVLSKEEQLLGQIPKFLNSHVGKTDLLRFLRDANIPLGKKESFLNSVLTILNTCKSTVALSQVLLSRFKSIADGMSDLQLSQRTAEIISTQDKNFYVKAKQPPPKTQIPASVGDKMKVYLKNLLSINVKAFANNVKVATKLKTYIENTDIPLENVRQLVLVYERIVLSKEEQLLGQIPKFLNSHVGRTDLLRFLRDANIPLGKKESFLNSVLTILNTCKSTVALSQVLLSRLKSIADGMTYPQLSEKTAEIISTQEKKFFAKKEKPSPQTQLPVSVTPDHAAMATYLKNVLATAQSTFESNMRQAIKIAPYLNSKQAIPLEIVRLLVLIYERIVITKDPRLLRTIPDFLNSKVVKQDLVRYLKEESVPSEKKQKIFDAILTILEAAKSAASNLDSNFLNSLKTVAVSLTRSQVKDEVGNVLNSSNDNGTKPTKSPTKAVTAGNEQHKMMEQYISYLSTVQINVCKNNLYQDSKLKPYLTSTDIPLANINLLVRLYDRVTESQDTRLIHAKIPEFLNSTCGRKDIMRYINDPSLKSANKKLFLQGMLTILESCKDVCVYNSSLMSGLKKVFNETESAQQIRKLDAICLSQKQTTKDVPKNAETKEKVTVATKSTENQQPTTTSTTNSNKNKTKVNVTNQHKTIAKSLLKSSITDISISEMNDYIFSCVNIPSDLAYNIVAFYYKHSSNTEKHSSNTKQQSSNTEQHSSNTKQHLSNTEQHSNNTSQHLQQLVASTFFKKQLPLYFIKWNSEKTLVKRQQVAEYTLSIIERCIDTCLLHSSFLDGLKSFVGYLLNEPINKRVANICSAMYKRHKALQRSGESSAGPLRSTTYSDHLKYDDFRRLTTFPGPHDLQGKQVVQLRPVVARGEYASGEDYLDTVYRLIREDLVAHLRDGVLELRGEKQEKTINLTVYRDVKIMYPLCTNRGVTFNMSFDRTSGYGIHWETSRKLIFGSLLCFSHDNFQTMIFGTVTFRSVYGLRGGVLQVRFEDNRAMYAYFESSTRPVHMVECPTFFEAYRHVMDCFKNINPYAIPMWRYLKGNCTEGQLPQYLRENSNVTYNMSSTFDRQGMYDSVAIVSTQLTKRCQDTVLNRSQLAALEHCLKNEFAVIQGPPGTGKTFCGLRIVHCLLNNARVWNPEKNRPLLIVCYTNHALDQFLDGLIKLGHTNVIRVGGRAAEHLEPYLLPKAIERFRRKSRKQGTHRMLNYQRTFLRTAIEDFARELQPYLHSLKCYQEATRKGKLVAFQEIKHCIADDHRSYFETEDASCILLKITIFDIYLDLCKIPLSILRNVARLESPTKNKKRGGHTHEETSYYGDYNSNEEVIDVVSEGVALQDRWVVDQEDYLPLNVSMGAYDNNNITIEMDEESDDGENLFYDDQGFRLVTQSKQEKERSVRARLSECEAMTAEEVALVGNPWSLLLEDRWRLYKHWLETFIVKYDETIETWMQQYEDSCHQSLQSRAEEHETVLRSADVIAMTTTCASRMRDMLEQIKPRVLVVEEAAEVLEAHVVSSLIPHTQHCILIGDHKQLRPSPNVHRLTEEFNLDVSLFERMVNNGMKCPMLNVQHRMRPSIAYNIRGIYEDLRDHDCVKIYPNVRGVRSNMYFVDHVQPEKRRHTSVSNPHEARFTAALCRYLLQQGYAPEQITVLTGYSAQLIELQNCMPKHLFEGVKVTTVDNFQGEENDIILLSLVRSNSKRSIGFLKIENRVCVALSRAKHGLFVVGNFSLLEETNEMWAGIIAGVRGRRCLGPTLPLGCQNHPDTTIDVAHPDDFRQSPNGGCMKPCAAELSCGHVCSLHCHPADVEHERYRCTEKCLKAMCSDESHICLYTCHENAECPPCNYLMEKTFPRCNHTSSVQCSLDPQEAVCPFPCSKILMNCGHPCVNQCGEECVTECQHPVMKKLSCDHMQELACNQDPDSAKCIKQCTHKLQCGHKCSGNCDECFQGTFHVKCRKRCGIYHSCSHACTQTCNDFCKPCQQQCMFLCDHGNCENTCGAACSVCELLCARGCIHAKCSKKCGEECDISPCSQRCTKAMSCGHQCYGMCGETCPDVCLKCDATQQPNAPLIKLTDCGHVCSLSEIDTLFEETTKKAISTLAFKKCPQCSAFIINTPRYASQAKTTHTKLLKYNREATVQAYLQTKPLKQHCYTICRQFAIEQLPKSTYRNPHYRSLVDNLTLEDFQHHLDLRYLTRTAQKPEVLLLCERLTVCRDIKSASRLHNQAQIIVYIGALKRLIGEKKEMHKIASHLDDLLYNIMDDNLRQQEMCDILALVKHFHLKAQLLACANANPRLPKETAQWFIKLNDSSLDRREFEEMWVKARALVLRYCKLPYTDITKEVNLHDTPMLNTRPWVCANGHVTPPNHTKIDRVKCQKCGLQNVDVLHVSMAGSSQQKYREFFATTVEVSRDVSKLPLANQPLDVYEECQNAKTSENVHIEATL